MLDSTSHSPESPHERPHRVRPLAVRRAAQAARAIALSLLACCRAASADAPLWLDGGRPSQAAHEAVALLAQAGSDGLDPEDYDARSLQQSLTRATQAPLSPDEGEATRLADRLESSMTRFLSDLHRGRLDPRSVHPGVKPMAADGFDAAAVLHAALAAHRLPQAVREAAPSLPQYERLREALAACRALEGHGAWRVSLPPLPGGRRGTPAKLSPGDAYAGLSPLAARLAAWGDLATRPSPAPARYDEPLVVAVRAFQARHGLSPDGVIGRDTFAQLQVPPSARVRQIELALERLRWTPLLQGPRMIVINIPEFVLRAYEVENGRIRVREEMKVIVGKAMDTRTPLISEDLRFIEFSPYWNVPPSIARKELVPRLRRDPGYFAREGFEFVTRSGEVDAALSSARLDAVLAGQARIRQRPGPANALGDIKFVFPNRDNIYLHHTPATALFERDRRDFSHGCIRVERPVALARFVLADMPEWDEARIREAMGEGTSRTMKIAQPLPVLIAYGTTLVKQGRIHFFDDIYGLDRMLDAALQAHARALRSATDRP